MSAPSRFHNLGDLDTAAVAYATRFTAMSPADPTLERERFIRECLPFARRLAGRYRDRGEPLQDLEQVARLGLVKAVDRYDPARGSFTAYAVNTISGELKRHFRDAAWAVHVPRPIRELLVELRHAKTELTGELFRTPTTAELAARVGATEREVTEALVANGGYSPASLDAPPTADDTPAHTLGDLLGTSDADLEMIDDRLTVARLLMRLPARERRILALRFWGNRTQVQIAAELGVSQMHISRLLSHALSWLREAMINDTPPPWNTASDTHALRLWVDHTHDILTIRACGEIDRDCAPRLRHCLRHAITTTKAPRMIVDLTGVALIDAAAVATLSDAASAADIADIELTLTGAGPQVLPILKLCGLAALVDG